MGIFLKEILHFYGDFLGPADLICFLSLLSGLCVQDVENIVNVRLLDLRDNKITQLPDEIICLQLLERLDVSNNDLSGLPFVLGQLSASF